MKYIINTIRSLIILTLLLILTGCWSYREVSQDFIATAAAIDKAKDGYLVTVEITNPKKGSETALKNDYIVEQGRTIFEAIRKTVWQSGKKMYWGHAKVIIISREVAEEGILPILDFLVRDTEIRNKIWLLISMEEDAAVLLKGKDEVHDAIRFHIDEIFKNQENIGMFYGVDLLAFLRDMSTEGISPTIATAKIVPTKDSKVPRVEGMAIFKSDKMIGWLDGLEVGKFLIIIDAFQGGEIVTLDVDGVRTTLEVLKSKTKIKPIFNYGDIIMQINIKMDVEIMELEGKGGYMNEDKVELIRQIMEQNVARDIEKLVKKVQDEYKVDIFGFGNVIYRLKPNVWKEIGYNWDEKYTMVKVEPNIGITIKGTGFMEKDIRSVY